MNEHTWHQRTSTPLVVAGLAYLVAYSWRVIADLSGPGRAVATTVIAVTWAMFIVDYLVRLSLAEHKRRWFRTHLPALAFALVPVLRLVRLLRVLTRVPGMKTTAGGVLRTQILVYGVGASVILIYLASLAVLEAERYAPDATITTFGIAVWWSCVTVTTTGFGDYTPVTNAGRFVGVGLMFGGVALAGVITATLASWVLERAAREHDDEEPATRAQLRTLTERIEQLAALAAVNQAAAAGSAPSQPAALNDVAAETDAGHETDAAHEADAEHETNGGDGGIGDGGDDRPGG